MDRGVKPQEDDGRWTMDDGTHAQSCIVRRPSSPKAIRPSSSSSFVFRQAHPTDKQEVLALTANTWENGDYIEWVFDDWINDPQGRFLVAIESPSGRIAGIDKLSFLSPTEAWFEGLRVHPDFRGRGLATSFQTYMIGEAQRLGAQTVRFLTNVDNLSVHRKAYRDGFSARFVVRHWHRSASGDMSREAESDSLPWQLRAATPDEASTLHQWWRRSASWQASGGLVNRNWSYSATSAEEWSEGAQRGELLIPEDTDVEALALPPPLALLKRGELDEENSHWTISLLSATGSEWGTLAPALVSWAASQGIKEVEGLIPDATHAYLALQQAGFKTSGAHASLCLFELSCTP